MLHHVNFVILMETLGEKIDFKDKRQEQKEYF